MPTNLAEEQSHDFSLLSLRNLLLKPSIPILFNKENYGLNLTKSAVMIVTPGHFFLEIEKAYQERESGLILLKVNPRWDPLRDDPRFPDLLRRMNLEP